MNKSYIQFSVKIFTKSSVELVWLAALCQRLFETDSEDWPEECADANSLLMEVLGYGVGDIRAFPAYHVGTTGVWFHDDEIGDPAAVALVALMYLRRFNPRGSFSIPWAVTCSKPLLDKFTGGAYFVTAAGIEYMEAGFWCADREEAWEKEMKTYDLLQGFLKEESCEEKG